MRRAISERPIGWSAKQQDWVPGGGNPGGNEDGDLDFGKLWSAVRRQFLLVSLCAILGLIAAAAVIMASVPLYTAYETVLYDEQQAELLDRVAARPQAMRTDSTVQSEIEIIRSRELALAVVNHLQLHEDEDFMNPPLGGVDQAQRWVRSAVDPIIDFISPEAPVGPRGVGAAAGAENAEDTSLMRAARSLQSSLGVRRVERSYVFEISFTDHDPYRAAEIARAYGSIYSRFRLDNTTEVARNAGEWLSDRLTTVEQQSIEASLAVEQFRQEHDLVFVRDDLLADQQLSEMASELVAASARTAEAATQLASFEQLFEEEADNPGAATAVATGTPSDQILADLRRDYLATTRDYREITSRYSEAHPQARALADTLAGIEAAIENELRRARNGLQSAYQQALAREEALREALDAATTPNSESPGVMGRLTQLQAIADTYSELYREYLSRYEQVLQQEFPLGAVQVISPADVPEGASSPQKHLLLMLGLVFGGLGGAALGGYRELREHPLRTGEEVAEQLAVPCAGLAPRNAALRPNGRAGRGDRVLEKTLYRVKAAVDASKQRGRAIRTGGTIVGIANVTPDRHALTIAPQLMRVLSMSGARALLLDARGGAERGVAAGHGRAAPPARTTGVLRGQQAPISLVRLPSDEMDTTHDEDRPLPRELDALLREVRQEYDYAVVILPALTDTVIADALSRALDATVLVLPWGKVRSRLVREALDDSRAFASLLVTSVLAGANLRVARRYMRRGGFEESVVASS